MAFHLIEDTLRVMKFRETSPFEKIDRTYQVNLQSSP